MSGDGTGTGGVRRISTAKPRMPWTTISVAIFCAVLAGVLVGWAVQVHSFVPLSTQPVWMSTLAAALVAAACGLGFGAVQWRLSPKIPVSNQDRTRQAGVIVCLIGAGVLAYGVYGVAETYVTIASMWSRVGYALVALVGFTGFLIAGELVVLLWGFASEPRKGDGQGQRERAALDQQAG